MHRRIKRKGTLIFEKSHFYYDIEYSTETLSIFILVCLKMLLTTVI